MQIGRNIYELRKSKNMTQRQFADALDVSCATVSKWEKNKALPTPEHITKICVCYDVDANFIYETARNVDSKKISECMMDLEEKLKPHELLVLAKTMIEQYLEVGLET